MRLRLACSLLIVLALVIWVITLVPQHVNAAASLVQVTSANSSTSPVSVTYSTAATSGKLLIAICTSNAAATITAPTGFSTAINESGDPAQGIFYKVAAGGESSVSCSFSAGGTGAIQLYEYSGIENVSPLDVVNTTSSSGTTSPASSGTLTSNNTNDLLLAGIVSDASSGISSWANSFTQETGGTAGGNPAHRTSYASADLSVSSTSSYSTTATVGGGSNWRGQIAAFKIAPAPVFSGDIVDGSGTSVSSPSITMTSTAIGFSCQTVTGTLGTSSQKIRITNTTPADNNGWNLTIGASSSNWSDGAGHSYAYNNSAGSPAGCTSGQLTVDPTTATITPETAPEYGCTTTGVSKYGSSTAFTSTSSATLITAGGTSSHYCYYDITGIGLSQKIPATQHSGSYSINLTLTLTAL